MQGKIGRPRTRRNPSSWLLASGVDSVIGGLPGIFVARQLEQRHVRRLQEQLDRGGLLLWVRTPPPDAEARARATLKAHGGEDVHLHDLPEQHYERGGGVSRNLGFKQTVGMSPLPGQCPAST